MEPILIEGTPKTPTIKFDASTGVFEIKGRSIPENSVDFYCFEARQKRILIGDTHGFVDLVFYHRILKCHVLVELKVESFNHGYLGQLNTYVSWYRKNMMSTGDNPPVGILLCTQKDHALVEYALAGMGNNMFVSKYQL